MKTVSEAAFRAKLEEALVHANFHIRGDVLEYFQALHSRLSDGQEKTIVDIFLQNAGIARNESRAVCQDTGYVQLYIETGDQVLAPFDMEKAVNETVAKVYNECGLRFSLADPLTRLNTESNTPAFIDWERGKGDTLKVTVMLKGGGSENVTRTGYLLPTAGREEIIAWVMDALKAAGSKACPPYLVGVAIGGTLEKAVGLSKKLLLLPIGDRTGTFSENELADILLSNINTLPTGFQGFHFGDTAMDVQVRSLPCHIATLPVALSIGCNAVRESGFTL